MVLLSQALPVFNFANQASLDMLEATLAALQDITLEKILDDHGRKALCSEFPQTLQQVHFVVPPPPKKPSTPFVPLPEFPHSPINIICSQKKAIIPKKSQWTIPIQYHMVPTVWDVHLFQFDCMFWKVKLLGSTFFSKYWSFDPKMQTFDAMASH